jgi:isoleucyl-tRNA synthetase
LEACGTRGRAPFKTVLTHGFVLDEKGYKQSKSLGNTVEPQKVAEQNGIEIMRIWASSSDFTEDLRLGPEILKANVESYRKLRNTMRYILANLKDWKESERVAVADMPELERWVLHRLSELDHTVRTGYSAFDFNRVFTAIFNFTTSDLSAFYFDIRKDALYCDATSSLRRRAARTVLDHLFHTLTAWLAPVMVFTMEEVLVARVTTANTTASTCAPSRRYRPTGRTKRWPKSGAGCATSAASSPAPSNSPAATRQSARVSRPPPRCT